MSVTAISSRLALRALLLLLLISALLAASVVTGRALLPAGQQIAYASERGGRMSIYLLDVSRSLSKRLYSSGDGAGWPVWSPDGTRIAFVSGGDIFLMNADGGQVRNLTQAPELDEAPVWSPDGHHIAFTRSDSRDNRNIYRVDADGSNLRRLTHNAIDFAPVWSPDGTQIAFRTKRYAVVGSVNIMAADGSSQRHLAEYNGYGSSLTWSPDGKNIIFEAALEAGKIFIMDTSDGSGSALSLTYPYSVRPLLSPDGLHLLFSIDRGSSYEIFRMDLNTQALVDLTHTPQNDDFAPAWSPDGRSIVFVRSDLWDSTHLYVINSDGSGLRQLTRGTHKDMQPAWRP